MGVSSRLTLVETQEQGPATASSSGQAELADEAGGAHTLVLPGIYSRFQCPVLGGLLFIQAVASTGVPSALFSDASCTMGPPVEAHICWMGALCVTKAVELFAYYTEPPTLTCVGLRFFGSVVSYADVYTAVAAAVAVNACDGELARKLAMCMAGFVAIGVVVAQWVILAAVATCKDPGGSILVRLLHLDVVAAGRPVRKDTQWLVKVVLMMPVCLLDIPQAFLKVVFLTRVQWTPVVIASFCVHVFCATKAVAEWCVLPKAEEASSYALVKLEEGVEPTKRPSSPKRISSKEAEPFSVALTCKDLKAIQNVSFLQSWGGVSAPSDTSRWVAHSVLGKSKQSFSEKPKEEYGEKCCPRSFGLATACRKGLKPEALNQDSWAVLRDKSLHVYCVFDGHGDQGEYVSEFAATMFLKILLSDKRMPLGNLEDCLKDAFVQTQRCIALGNKMSDFDAELAGTTATAVIWNESQKRMYVAHTGDSRAVVAKTTSGCEVQVLHATQDHKPDVPAEKERIEANGGMVVFDGFFNHRVFVRGESYPGLNMSRCLGDLIAHRQAGVTAVPEVTVLDLSDGGEFILLICSDGVWEFLEPKQAIDLVNLHERSQVFQAANALAQKAWDEWMADSGHEVSDDITVVVQHISVPK
eukprot:TRINITY_DN5340_c0_g1_i1.p1 TRINITY_DN5340_c0_g1~~TRINITY_DN5340_c0_g1_i1.p1  ORF type:complete len:642 (+),score=102.58 TRINITY_DN5340_c0_g1_i1:89-2014(+)